MFRLQVETIRLHVSVGPARTARVCGVAPLANPGADAGGDWIEWDVGDGEGVGVGAAGVMVDVSDPLMT